MLPKKDVETFQKKILSEGKRHYRDMPWRNANDPFHIFISEVMLQQTQVDRVIPKFQHFIEKFPTIDDLADASLKDVLAKWSGLGYNSRGMRLYQSSRLLRQHYNSEVPKDVEALNKLPGIGPNTAASICVYSFNMPLPFVETNIRTVFIHEFFKDKEIVDDKQILELVEQTLYKRNPREWYWALMDYGSYLKKIHKSLNSKSKHYKKQSTFSGSDRQLRGEILRILLEKKEQEKSLKEKLLQFSPDATKEKIEKNLQNLVKDGLIVNDEGGFYEIKGE